MKSKLKLSFITWSTAGTQFFGDLLSDITETGMGNGEWYMGNGEWGMGMGNGKYKWETGNGKSNISFALTFCNVE